MSIASKAVPSLARWASTSAAPSANPKFLVVGAGAGGLAAANQIYNAFKASGNTLKQGDVAILDVRRPRLHELCMPHWLMSTGKPIPRLPARMDGRRLRSGEEGGVQEASILAHP